MKFIHCSDLHLDSRMETNLPKDKAAVRKNEILGTFVRLCGYARDNHADAVFVCGDMFDTGRVRKTTTEVVLDAIRSAPDVLFFVLRGNHDAAADVFDGQEIPENLKFFSDEWRYYSLKDSGNGAAAAKKNVTVAGIELTRKNAETLYGELRLPEDTVNIVLMHGQIASRAGDENICLPSLCGKNIDYLALGHLHSFEAQRLDGRGVWAYSGTLEGRGFDECGEKGFVQIETVGGELDFKFVPFAERTIEEISVDITELGSVAGIRSEIEKRDVPESAVVKVILRGSAGADAGVDTQYLESALRGRYFFVKVEDEAALAVDARDFENDASLKGEFIRRVLAQDMSDEDKKRVIRYGLTALTGEEVRA